MINLHQGSAPFNEARPIPARVGSLTPGGPEGFPSRGRICYPGTTMDKLKKILLILAGNPLFWIILIVGSLLLFIYLFERVPSFGVNKVYHIFD